MKPICIYHGNCADGFGAAWVVRKALGDIDFHAGVYGNAPPDVADRDVILVDFSYKRDALLAMLQSGDVRQANTILILDHHKTAAQDLAGIEAPEGGYDPDRWRTGWEQRAEWAGRAVFDMNRSGAGVTWDFFFHGQARPALIDHIEDRDLWMFALPHTREIQAALFSHPYDFKVWDELMTLDPQRDLAIEGAAIERKHHKDIAELTGVVTRTFNIAGQRVPLANLPYTLTSDAGHLLCKLHGAPFAGCYWDTPEGRVFSLRSLDDGADVAEIAKQYGGGGHAHASGFRIPFDQLAQFEV